MIRVAVGVVSASVLVYLVLRWLHLSAGDGVGWWSPPLAIAVAAMAMLAVTLMTVPDDVPPEAFEPPHGDA